MRNRISGSGVAGVGLAAAVCWLIAGALAPSGRMDTARADGPPDRSGSKSPREVTISGTVVDVHGSVTGTYASDDRVKCVEDNIRNGVPVALHTEDGLILLGRGTMGAGKMLAGLGLREVEIRGKLYEKFGIRYLDVAAVHEIDPVDEGDSDDEEGNDPDDPGAP